MSVFDFSIYKNIKDINDFDEEYGLIDGYPNYMTSSLGYIYNCKTGRILKPSLNSKKGYYFVGLCNKDGKHSKKIAPIILKSFFEKPVDDDEDFTCDHINRNKIDNNLNNLRWATKKVQMENRILPLVHNTKPGKLGEKYISENGNGFQVRIINKERSIRKNFPTLEQAIVYRDSIL